MKMEIEKEIVTERLKQSELRYYVLFENAPYSIITFDSRGIILDCNSTTEKVFGYKVTDLLGKNYLEMDMIPKEYRPHLKERLAKLAKGETSDPIEIKIKKADGSTAWVRSRISFVKLGAGFVLQCILEDITEKKEIELKLLDAEERYNAFFNQTIYSVYVHDFYGKFLDANDAALNLLGYRRDEIPTLNVASLISRDQLPRAVKTLQILKEKKREEVPVLFKLRKKDGNYVWLDTQSTAIYKEGKPFAVQGIAIDVTDRLQAEEALRTSEEQYRSIFEKMPTSIIVLDRERRIIECNDATGKLLGQETYQIIGKQFEEILSISELEREKIYERNQRLLEGDIVEPIDLQCKLSDGSVRWIQILSSLYILKGEWIGFQILATDISEMKEAAEKLEESEEKFSNVFTFSNDAIILTDFGGNILDVNPKSCKLFAYTKDEFKQLNRRDLYDREEGEKIDSIRDILLKDRFVTFETVFKKSGGNTFPAEVSASIFELGGIMVMQKIIRDVTDRKVAEEQLKIKDIAIESAQSGIVLSDLSGTLTYANKAALQMWGYDKEEEVLGRKVVEFWEDIAAMLEAHKRLIEHRSWSSEQLAKRRDGSVFYATFLANMITDDSGNPLYLVGSITDITKQKQIERDLRNSEAKYRNIIENVKDAVLIIGIDGRFQFLSPQIFELVGRKELPTTLMEVTDLIHPDDVQRILEMFQITIQNRANLGSEELEFRARHQNGQYIWLGATSKAHQNDQGEFIGFISVIRDITERKKAELQLRESEEKYRLISENANDLITVHNQQHGLEYINEETCMKLLGYSLADLKTKTMFDLFHPDDLQQLRQSFMKALKEGEMHGEFRLKRQDGNYIWVETIAKAYCDNAGETKILTIQRDISQRKQAEAELKKSEEKYRLITENANDMISVTNHKLELEYLNQETHRRILGYVPPVGQALPEQYIHPEDREQAISLIRNSLKGAEANAEFRVRKGDGSYGWISAKAQEFYDSSGERKILTISRDISERKALEESRKNYTRDLEAEVAAKTEELKREASHLQEVLEKLQASQARLVQSEKLASIGLLAAGIAHEINNPLMGIINYAQILYEELKESPKVDLTKEPFSFLSGIVAEGKRISKIVEELLTFAKADPSQFITMNISDIIASSLSLLSSELSKSNIEIQLNLREEFPPFPIMPHKMQQVFINLLQNAISAIQEKFGKTDDSRRRRISIEMGKVEINKQPYGKISIHDNGQGIKHEYLSKVFDPFFTTKPVSRKHGMGLGLSISYGIVQDHGGDIQIESVWQEGTKVEVLLPFERKVNSNSHMRRV